MTPSRSVTDGGGGIARLHAVINRAHAELLAEVAAADADETYRASGASTPADWLVASLGVRAATARSWVRTARKLVDLPAVAAHMVAGRLGIDQTAMIVTFAEADDPVEYLGDYERMSADELADVARSNRRVESRHVSEVRFGRFHDGRFTDDGLAYEYRGRMPSQEGAVFEQGIRVIAMRDLRDENGQVRLYEHRASDALVEMASASIARETGPDRATVVVHVDAEALAVPDAVGEAEFGPTIPMTAIRRMLCDARIQIATRDDSGQPLGVGRVTRTIPQWLQRLIRKRDGGCRFPGCQRTRWVNSHHMHHWADGGPTDLDNLITLCGYHHRLLHEENWAVTTNGDGGFEWTTTFGFRHTPPDDDMGRDWDEFLRRQIDATDRRLAYTGTDPPD